jgi:phi13 family phage major tail protein
MTNKVKYGLKNVHYAVITESSGAVSYGTPVHIPGAVNLTLSPVGEKVRFAADDREDYFAENINNGYDGNLEMALIPD